MKSSGDSRSDGDVFSAVRTRSRETALSAAEADALHPRGGLGLLITPALTRTRLRRESSLGTVCGDATGERRGAVLRTSALSATPALSWRRCAAGARFSGLGHGEAGRQRRRGDVRCLRTRTDAEVSQSMFSLFCHANT